MILQEPSEEAFDINSVPKEVKSQPLAEKKAQGKKPTGLGAPPAAPSSGFDGYEKLLSSIPEFAAFGKLFKVRGEISFPFRSNVIGFPRLLELVLPFSVFFTCGAN